MNKYWIMKVVLLGSLVILGVSTALMLLWNWLVPTLFRGPVISIWQSLSLLIFTKLLFEGWNRWGSGRHRRYTWKKKFEAKWNKMTPEEQERFKRSFIHQCHCWRWNELEQEPDKQDDESDRVKVG